MFVWRRRWVLRRLLSRRLWLLRFSLKHGNNLARHGANDLAAWKIRALSVVLPLISGLGTHMRIKVHLQEGAFVVTDASELLVLVEVFAEDAYPREALPPTASTIVDAGANVGATLRYFRTQYPDAFLIGLEPDPRTYDVCRQNIEDGAGISLRNQALAGHTGQVTLIRPRGESWATSASGVGRAFTATAVTLDSLVEELRGIDLLKIDIEGAEWEVLRVSERLKDVAWIVGEFHPQAGVSSNEFLGLLTERFDIVVDTIAVNGTFALRRRI